jgi:hypothetical protein
MNKKKEVKDIKEFTTTAFDVVFDETKRVFNVITVGYDAKTKEAQVLKKEVLADSKAMALHLAKEKIIKRIFNID